MSKYSFSILSGDLSLLDLDAVHVYQFAEWTDGISVLGKDDKAGMRHKESVDKVRVSASRKKSCDASRTDWGLQILADVALKVRLLDITGDGVEIPERVAVGPGQ